MTELGFRSSLLTLAHIFLEVGTLNHSFTLISKRIRRRLNVPAHIPSGSDRKKCKYQIKASTPHRQQSNAWLCGGLGRCAAYSLWGDYNRVDHDPLSLEICKNKRVWCFPSGGIIQPQGDWVSGTWGLLPTLPLLFWKILRKHFMRKGNPLTLLVGMQTSTATMENSVEIS